MLLVDAAQTQHSTLNSVFAQGALNNHSNMLSYCGVTSSIKCWVTVQYSTRASFQDFIKVPMDIYPWQIKVPNPPFSYKIQWMRGVVEAETPLFIRSLSCRTIFNEHLFVFSFNLQYLQVCLWGIWMSVFDPVRCTNIYMLWLFQYPVLLKQWYVGYCL